MCPGGYGEFRVLAIPPTLMVHLKVLSGKQAGSVHALQKFPCLFGRSSAADICLEENGVWDRHSELIHDQSGTFVLRCFSDAGLCVNGRPVIEASLRNGDLIELGAVRLQFWLAETRQRSLCAREWLTWTAFTLLCLGQIYLIYLLAS
jgi:pSer/pThr/pTyr-binding forkhead associated (FHA) protein